MFNVFKALKLHGITTLPNVNRPAGSVGGVDDWYEDYVDWLLANQQAPTNSGGGHWSTMSFSSITSNTDAQTAIAELILAPVALIPPDETKFSTIGLQPPTASRTINTTHTVTGKAESAGGSGIPGVTMTIKILTGPNAGEETTGTTDGNGELKFTYPGDEGVGQDTLQAYIGQLASNQVTVNWVVGTTACDADGNKKVENADLMLIRAAMGKPKSGATDPRDGNGDGAINIADLRFCQLKLGTVYP
jgi:hypothetical protein